MYRAHGLIGALVAAVVGCTQIYGDPIDPQSPSGVTGEEPGPPGGDVPNADAGGGTTLPPLPLAPPWIVGTFRNGTWRFDTNGNGTLDAEDEAYTFGSAGDLPVVGDWTGDGKPKIGVFQYGWWSLDMNGDGVYGPGDKQCSFGMTGDIPLAGDWTGDGKTKIGVFRKGPSGYGEFSLDLDGNCEWSWTFDTAFNFGNGTDRPIVAPWPSPSPTKVAKIAVLRDHGSFLSWNLDLDGNRTWNWPPDGTYDFGSIGDKGVVGDWTGVGVPLFGVYRDGVFHLDIDGDRRWDGLHDKTVHFGNPGDEPVAEWRR